jgi:ABC-type nitrate/sulfonate/bicarbonate transport system substrate-binding protein
MNMARFVANTLRRSRTRLIPLGGAVLLTAAGVTGANAQPAPVEVSYGILNYTAAEWPLMLAQTQGFFKKEGLNITVVSAGSPPNVINALATNGVNIAEDGTDSYIAAVAHHLPIKMIAPVLAVDPYSLMVAPSITSIEQLKGKTIMLGTKQDVTAITFGAMLAPLHLTLNDFSVVTAGSTTARWAALQSGNAQGAMLLQPFDLEALAKGFHSLGSGKQVLNDWVFTTIAVNNGWAATHRAAIVGTLRALREGIQYGATHKAEAIATLISYTHSSPEIAAKTYDQDFNQWKAFRPDLNVTPEQLATIAKYQIQFGVITAAPSFADLYDGSYAEEARKSAH